MKIFKTKKYDKWFSKEKDKVTRFVIKQRIDKIELENHLGDYKDLKDGVYELRFDFKGIRIYFTFVSENEIILLLLGGNKTSQKRDVEMAKKMKRGLQNG